MKSSLLAYTFLAGVAALTACGGPASVSTPAVSGSSLAEVDVVFHWPNPRTPAGRTPAFVSPSAQSIEIAVNGGTAVATNAPVGGSPQTSNIIIQAPLGSDTFVVSLYDQTNGGGNLLGQVTVPQTINEGVVNSLSFVVNGNVTAIGIPPVPKQQFQRTTTATTGPGMTTTVTAATLIGDTASTFAFVPYDADNNVIVAPGVPTIALANATGFTTTSLGGNMFAVQAAKPAAATTMTASATNVAGKSITATFTVTALAAVYVVNAGSKSVTVYDDNGVAATPVPSASPSFVLSKTAVPSGVTFVPGGSAGTGALYITESTPATGMGTTATGSVVAFDEKGNSLPTTGFAGLAAPAFPTFITSANEFLIPDSSANKIALFDGSGAAITAAMGAFPGLTAPNAVVFDANTGVNSVFVANTTPGTFVRFTSGGMTTKSIAAGTKPQGIAFDPAAKHFFVTATGGTGVGNAGQVLIFDETPATVAATGLQSFTGLTAPTGIALDTFNSQLYVNDASGNVTMTYTEAGAAGASTGTFAGESSPQGIAIVP